MITLHVGNSAADSPRGVNPVQARHRDVHEHDVGTSRPGDLERFVPVNGLEDLRLVERALEQRANAGPHQRVVVSDQYFHGHAAVINGTRHSTIVPPPRLDRIFSVPPTCSTRSCIPIRPR